METYITKAHSTTVWFFRTVALSVGSPLLRSVIETRRVNFNLNFFIYISFNNQGIIDYKCCFIAYRFDLFKV